MEEDLKKEAEKLMQVEGNVKGEVFLTHANFIFQKEGDEGIRRVEKRLEELGYPLKLRKVETGKWYREALSVLTVLTAKEVFGWTDEDIYEMGNTAPKTSFIIKIFIRHLASIEDVLERVGQYWEKHYDFGAIEKSDFNKKERYIIVRVRGYGFHPLLCGPYFKGYLTRIAQFSIKSDNIKTEETACIFKGDLYNEYKITW